MTQNNKVTTTWGKQTHQLTFNGEVYNYDGNVNGGRLYKKVAIVNGVNNGFTLQLVLGKGGAIQFYNDELPIELLQALRSKFH